MPESPMILCLTVFFATVLAVVRSSADFICSAVVCLLASLSLDRLARLLHTRFAAALIIRSSFFPWSRRSSS